MPKVDIRQPTPLSPDQARQRIEAVVSKMHQQFGTEGSWDGDCYRFSRTGLSGCVTLEPGSVRIELELGLLMAPFKPMIEQEIRRQFSKHLE